MANIRKRPKISITVDAETLRQVDELAKRLRVNRSRVLEKLVVEGVTQHRFLRGSSGPLPDVVEVYRRVYVYPNRYEMGGTGVRTHVYDLRWEELPEELQELFDPGVTFEKWTGTADMLKGQRIGLEALLEKTKSKLAQLEEKPEARKPARRGK